MKAFKDWIIAHKLLSIIIAAVVLVGATCAIVLPIALSHKHEFSAEWAFDGESHWHACVGKDCNEVEGKAAHVYDNACDATCNVCGIARAASEHVYENAYDEACKVCGATRNLRYQAKDKAEWLATFDFSDTPHVHITTTFGDTSGEMLVDGDVIRALTYEKEESGMSKVAESFFVKDGETYYCVEWLGDSVYKRKSLDKEEYEVYFKEISLLAIGELKYSDFSYNEETHEYFNESTTSKHTLVFVNDVIAKIEAVVKGVISYDIVTTITFEENALTIPEYHVFADSYSFDEENHWYACTDEGCEVVYKKTAHRFETKKDGAKQVVGCYYCGYEIDVSAMTINDADSWEKALTFADGGYQVVLKKGEAIIEDCRYAYSGNVSNYYKNWKGNETYYTVEEAATGFDCFIYEKNDSGAWERRSIADGYGSAEEANADVLNDGCKLTGYWLGEITTAEAFKKFTFSAKDFAYHTETSYTLGNSVFADEVVTTHIMLKFKNGLLTYAEFTDGTNTYTIEVVNDSNAVQIDLPETSDIKFTHSMSKADIIAKLGEVENFTYDEYYDGVLNYTTYVGTDYYCYSGFSDGAETRRYFEFVEDSRYYEISYYNDNLADALIDIIDFNGYDIDFNSDYGVKNEIDSLIDYINEDKYVVENGNLKVTYEEYGGTTVAIYRNFNATSKLALSETLKDYKTKAATESAVEYLLGSDGTYSVKSVHFLIASYEVPATYNGSSVTNFSTNPPSILTTLTLPKSITTLYSLFARYEDDEELHIVYKGTKAEWEAIENSDVWSKTENVRITCSDGDYVVSAE